MPTRELIMGHVVIIHVHRVQLTKHKHQSSSPKLQLDFTFRRLPANHSDNFVVLILAHGTYPFYYYYYYYFQIFLFFILAYGTYPFIIIILIFNIFSNFQNLMQRVPHQAYQVERERRSFIVCADHAGQFVKDVFFFFFLFFGVPRLCGY
jgi:hypothetical protein